MRTLVKGLEAGGLATAVALSLGLASNHTQPSAADRDPGPRLARIERGLLPAILLAGAEPKPMSLPDRIEHYQVPGLSLAVVDGFELAWTRTYGLARSGTAAPITPDTLFQAGSVSKVVAALLTLKLIDAGQLALDTPVNDVLKTWKLPDRAEAGPEPVRIRHLLTHSAGLSRITFSFYEPGEAVPTLVQALDGEAPAGNPAVTRLTPPGHEAEYSNAAFAVLEQLLVDATGRPFDALARQELFEPLAMASSSFARTLPPPLFERAAYGHSGDGKALEGKGLTLPTAAVGGLWTTPADLGRLLVGVLRAHRGDAGAFLSKALAREMLRRQIDDRGLGVSIDGEGAETYLSQGGGTVGFLAHIVANPETGQGAAVMVNGGRGSMGLIHELVRSIAVEYDWPGYVLRREVVPLQATAFARHEGCYEFIRPAGLRMRIHSESGRFFRGRTEMFPVSETVFVVPELGHEIEFVAEAAGRSTALFYGEPGGAKAKAVRNDSVPPEECRPR
jgi:CubicO group peptidase (beta-lactamase class C family)